jgi:peptidoglycan/xylan/chitin deacetylase (PgdA/CDA1 family)
MYHRIVDESFDPWALAVSPERLDEQLAWLKRSRQVLSMPQFAELHASGRLPANAAAITFDDGYACNALAAAPLLHRHGSPATVYLATNAVRSGREFWWDELEHLVLEAETDQLDLDLPAGPLRVPLGARQPDDRSWPPSAAPRTARQRAFHEVWAALRTLDPNEQQSAMDQVRAQAKVSPGPRDSHRPMTAEEVRSLEGHGIEVGAHSLSHTSLPARTTAEKEREIYGSRDECADITGTAPRNFAYPFGDWDEETSLLVRQAGFESACSTVEIGVGRGADLYALPRIQVGNWTSGDLAHALARL